MTVQIRPEEYFKDKLVAVAPTEEVITPVIPTPQPQPVYYYYPYQKDDSLKIIGFLTLGIIAITGLFAIIIYRSK